MVGLEDKAKVRLERLSRSQHIVTDRGEYDNIAKEKPEIVGEMKTILEKEKSKGVGMEL